MGAGGFTAKRWALLRLGQREENDDPGFRRRRLLVVR